MTQIVSSISSLEIYAPSAGSSTYAKCDANGRDLGKMVTSADVSAYQVVSATGAQLYAGTSYLTSVNTAPVSASRAGNAANASMANSAYYDGTGRLISALPDSATVSAIASGYGAGKVDKSAISAQSSQWNSVYTTVNLNSANWSGSEGGSVSSPSGTIYVDGSQIEGTNSAVQLITSDYMVYLSKYAGTNAIGDQLLLLTPDSVAYTGCHCTFALFDTAYIQGTAILSGRDPDGNYASASGYINVGQRTFKVPMGQIVSGISGSANTWYNFDNYADFTATRTGMAMITGVGELAWKSAVDNVTNTVANNSASWAGGATGDYVEKSAVPLEIGSSVSASSTSIAMGSLVTASRLSVAIGRFVSASSTGVALGAMAIAKGQSFAYGWYSTAFDTSVSLGPLSDAYRISFACGYNCHARNSAVAIGENLSAGDTNTVFGQFNSTSNSANTVFVIGDGTAQSARHNLLEIVRDGEITLYSSTADTTGTGIMSAIRAISAAATGASVSLPITGSAGSDSATYAATSVAFVRNDTAGEPDIRTASMSPDQFQINYTYNNQDYTSVLLNENMLEFGDSDGSHVVDAYSIDSWNSAVDTVANNSATWGQGGVDSATVSAIASSYAESAVSSKADSSALSSYALSADVSGAVNKVTASSGYWDAAVTKLNNSSDAWNSAYNTVSANSASWGQGGVDSATVSAIASSYADSAGSVAASYTDTQVSSRMYASAMQVVTSESLATANGVLYIVVN